MKRFLTPLYNFKLMIFPKESSSEAPEVLEVMQMWSLWDLICYLFPCVELLVVCCSFSRFWAESNQAGALGKDLSQQLWWCWEGG